MLYKKVLSLLISAMMTIGFGTEMIPQSAIQNMKSNMIDLIDIDGLNRYSIDGLNLLELL